MPAPAPAQGAKPPQAAQGQPPQGGQGPQQGSPSQLVSTISQSLQQLMKVMDSAGNQIDPKDKQQLGAIMSSFQDLVQELSGGGQQQAQAPAPAQQAARPPMPAHANKGARPAPSY